MNNLGGKVSILIPTYNEEGIIGRAIEEIRNVMPNSEIIVVDDGSMDQTVREARRFERGKVKVIPLTHRGKGSAIKKAIEIASGEVMVQIDADLQFPPKYISRLIEPILEERADIVFGSRYLKSSHIEEGSVSLVKRIASYVVALSVSVICRRRLTDVFAGFKAWKTKAIRDIDFQEEGFAYEVEIAIKAHRLGYAVVEVPTDYRKRTTGISKIKFFVHAFEIPFRLLCLLLFKKGKLQGAKKV
ncbi:MAG: glycosyltransferase [Candidatus Omnitrophica bacterium]|nr:glycosyltransferase [Candidatus Omnitrophota bacterium]